MKLPSNSSVRSLRRTALGLALIGLVSIVSSCGTGKITGTPVKSTDVPNLSFSAQLGKYLPHPTARSRTVDEIYNRTANSAITLSPDYVDNEILAVLKTQKLFVVPPLITK